MPTWIKTRDAKHPLRDVVTLYVGQPPPDGRSSSYFRSEAEARSWVADRGLRLGCVVRSRKDKPCAATRMT